MSLILWLLLGSAIALGALFAVGFVIDLWDQIGGKPL
jgi:hypothetical protein